LFDIFLFLFFVPDDFVYLIATILKTLMFAQEQKNIEWKKTKIQGNFLRKFKAIQK
jgi:hypothetical protein